MRYLVLFMMVLSICAQEKPAVDNSAKKELAGIKVGHIEHMFYNPTFRKYLDETPSGTKSFSDTFYCVVGRVQVMQVVTTAILSKASIPTYESQVVKWGNLPVQKTKDFLPARTVSNVFRSNYIIEIFSLPHENKILGSEVYVVTDKEILKYAGNDRKGYPVLNPVMVLDPSMGQDRFYRIPILVKKNPTGAGERVFGILKLDDSMPSAVIFASQVNKVGGVAGFMPIPERIKEIPVIGIVKDSKGEFLNILFPENVIGQRQRAHFRQTIKKSREKHKSSPSNQ
jgi:hypothetical protein